MTPEAEPASQQIASVSPPDRRHLDRALIRGVAWTGALRWGTQILTWGITIALARILSPTDYGLFGLAWMYVAFVQLVNEFGLGAAIVRQRSNTEEQIAALGGVSIALGLTLWGVSALLAPAIAAFFRTPALQWPLVALSGIFLTTALKVLPKSLLARELQFKRVAAIDATESVVNSVAILTLALLGWRHWALMAGMLIGAVTSTALALAWRPHRLGWPRRFEEIRHAVSFGSHIMVSRLAWYVYSNADNATVGRKLGGALLGNYVYAWTLATIPVDRVGALVGQVTPAIFSAVQDDLAGMRRYLARITEGLAIITFPLGTGLATVSDLFVVGVLGPKWWPAIAPLAVLAFYGGFRAVTTPYPHVLQALGHSRQAMRFSLLGVVVLLPLFYFGSMWGLLGVALGWIVGYPIVVAPMLRAVLRECAMPARDYLDALRPATVASLVMAAGVLGIRGLLPEAWPAVAHLGVAVVTGVLVYGAMFLGPFRARLAGLKTLVRELRR